VHHGEDLAQGIEVGQFLDVFGTHYYKATQVAQFIKAMRSGAVKAGDTVLLLDGWNPMVECLAYIRDAMGLKVKIAGCLHAGTWDAWDFLSQKGLGRWAASVERGWFEAYDHLFVATGFHRNLILEHAMAGERSALARRVHVTGFPLYAGELAQYQTPWADRPRRVVFPHRLALEKDPDAFARLEASYRNKYGDDGTEWVRSRDVYTGKSSYYTLLGGSRVSVSTAKQETWGIAMLESLALGCHTIAPYRLSYPETLPRKGLYDSLDEAVALIHTALDAKQPAAYDGTAWETAIAQVVKVLQGNGA